MHQQQVPAHCHEYAATTVLLTTACYVDWTDSLLVRQLIRTPLARALSASVRSWGYHSYASQRLAGGHHQQYTQAHDACYPALYTPFALNNTPAPPALHFRAQGGGGQGSAAQGSCHPAVLLLL
jgi:hypothetical protein